jgi:hypothetical protein
MQKNQEETKNTTQKKVISAEHDFKINIKIPEEVSMALFGTKDTRITNIKNGINPDISILKK